MLGLLIILSLLLSPKDPAGVSFFAIQHKEFPCERALKVFDKVHTEKIAMLWGTFGNDNSCLEKWITRNTKGKILEIHFANGSCLRSKRCRAGEIWGSSVADVNRRLEVEDSEILHRVRKRAGDIMNFIAKYQETNTDFLISTGLEDNYSQKAYTVLVKELKKNFHKIVRNQEGSHETYASPFADYIELHGLSLSFKPDTRSCITNNDGFPFTCAEHGQDGGRPGISEMLGVLKRERACENRFVWLPSLQGIFTSKFIEPRKRHPRISDSCIRAVNLLLRRSV